jgi:hypothetical protein
VDKKKDISTVREFFRDIAYVVISFFPISGYISLTHFLHKWFYRHKLHRKVHMHMSREISRHGKTVNRHIRKHGRNIHRRLRLKKKGIFI